MAVTFDGPLMWLFGGRGEAACALNDVWIFDARAWSWERPTVSGVPPSARWGHSAALVTVRGRIVVLGGQEAAGTFTADMHLFDLGTLTWSSVEVCGKVPPARAALSAVSDRCAEDALATIWTFGGEGKSTRLFGFGATDAVFSDLHRLQLEPPASASAAVPSATAAASPPSCLRATAEIMLPAESARPLRPAPRAHHQAVLLQHPARLVVYGGGDGKGLIGAPSSALLPRAPARVLDYPYKSPRGRTPSFCRHCVGRLHQR